MYNQFIDFITPFCLRTPGAPVDGTYYELPDITVYTTHTLALPAKGRIEVNAITPETPADFEWRYELTIKDKVGQHFIHLIIRHDESVVETYGKTIIPVDEARASEILSLLKQLVATS